MARILISAAIACTLAYSVYTVIHTATERVSAALTSAIVATQTK